MNLYYLDFKFEPDMNKKIEVKYNGVVIGYSDGNNSITFLDTKEAQEAKHVLLEGHPIGISSRRIGTVENNIIPTEEHVEDVIVTLNKNTKL